MVATYCKFALDKVISLAGMVIFAPALLLLFVLVRLLLGSPAIFKQQRPGLHGRPFMIYKFRTMKDTRDSSGELLTDGERMTRFGYFLRNTSLDELPELFNVLKGDLSFVGPRPLLMEYLPRYSPEQTRRHDVKPGITGWAQVNGRNAISWDDKFKLDIWYVDNRSFWLDCKILWLTLVKVLKREGITQQGHVTMEKFKGNEKGI
jgi:sugar transferase EpsL